MLMNVFFNKCKVQGKDKSQGPGNRKKVGVISFFFFLLGQFRLHKYLSNACYVFINLFFFPISELDTEFAWDSGCMPQEFLSPSSSSVS